jgi:hypothetical protein
MRAEKKSHQTFKSAKNAEGYLIVNARVRYYSETFHLAASAITGFRADKYGRVTILFPQIEKDHSIEIMLSMPLECAQYFLHLAKQGMHVDLSDYSGQYPDKEIQPDSPEHHKFRLPLQSVTPDELSNMRHNFVSAAPLPSPSSAFKEKETAAEKDGLDRFPFLSDAERAKMKAEAARRKKYKL